MRFRYPDRKALTVTVTLNRTELAILDRAQDLLKRVAILPCKEQEHARLLVEALQAAVNSFEDEELEDG